MKHTFLTAFFLFLTASVQTSAQPAVIKDHHSLMEIPAIVAMASSPAHIYVLSQEEGMAVFRTSADTLQWLYTSPNMQRRGNQIRADIRFAYLFSKEGNRFTVLEPTSLLGVYSSTILPHSPMDAARLDDFVYISLGRHGLVRLSLESPESVDTEPENVLPDHPGVTIRALASNAGRLFALSADRKLFHFTTDGEQITLAETRTLSNDFQRIFLTNDILLGTTSNGKVIRIGADGSERELFSVGSEVSLLDVWGDFFAVRETSGRVWLGKASGEAHVLRADPDSGNLFTVSKNNLWMTEFNQLSLLQLREAVAGAPTGSDTTAVAQAVSASAKETPVLKLSRIDDMVLPFPRALLVHLGLEEDFPADDVRFQVRSRLQNVQIRNRGLYWRPTPRDVGHHAMTVIATSRDGQVDSTSFHVEVRNFNAPPRFSPIRPITIPVNEEFELPIRANDPDGMDPNLIRYIGIDLPEGSQIDERTGTFTWTPHRRQTGEHKFDVIATDQYGAAASITVTITVVSLSRDS